MAIFNTVPPLQAGAGIKFDGLTISTAAAPRNLLDNSDFTNLVAQAGIGGNHGTVAYAADRWILDSGTVSYAAGVGLTLNGTIRQKLEFPPTGDAISFVGMASGEASIRYEDRAVTITSSGGVLKWAALYKGSYTAETLPEYQPKGYCAELEECQRYYFRITSDWLYGHAIEGEGFNILVIALTQMRSINITVENSGIKVYNDGTWHEVSIVNVKHLGGGMYEIVCALNETFAMGASYLITGITALNSDL